MRELLAITKALADENRLRVLYALRRGELCVCQITEFLGLASSTVSKHMSILRNARLVESRKESRWIYYRLADNNAPTAVREALAWALHTMAGSAQIREDDRALKKVLKCDPEALCRKQSGR